jgi:LPS sulfotransferase NodH
MRREVLIPNLCYFICTLPRSGSWLLAESLERTRIAGRPREYFEPKLYVDKPALSYATAINAIIPKGMTKNRVFSAKLHWYQFEFASRLFAGHDQNDAPTALVLAESLPGLKYVWLTRRHKTRQAISYYRASKTDKWWHIPGVNDEVPPLTPEFDFDRINHLERLLLNHEAQWQKYFDENNIDPLLLVYEEFADDPAVAVREVLMYMGLSAPKGINLETRLHRQSDAVTEKWVETYSELKQNRFGNTR